MDDWITDYASGQDPECLVMRIGAENQDTVAGNEFDDIAKPVSCTLNFSASSEVGLDFWTA